MQLYIVETIDGVDKKIEGGWSWSNNLLRYTVKPKSDAVYTVYFIYREGEQEEQKEVVKKTLKVLPPIEIVLPEGLKLCGDGENNFEVELESVTPAGTLVTWDDDESIVSGRDGNSITINPEFDVTASSNSFYKSYTLRASYSICSEVTKTVAVRVDRPLTGEIVGPEIICEGSVATIDASSYAAETYLWTSTDDTVFLAKYPDGANMAAIPVRPDYSSTYNVAMTRGECSAEDSWSVIVSETPEIVSVDSMGYHSRSVQVSGGATPYTYFVKDVTPAPTTESTIDNLQFGIHTVVVVDNAGCSTAGNFKCGIARYCNT